MQKGDLTTTPIAPLLLSLADEDATGCLHISDAEGDEALIYFRSGLVYAVSVPNRRPQLGAKLVSSGALAPEALAEALEAQRTELQGWKLGELLVHLGYVDQPVVEAFVKEQVNDAVWDLIRWTEGRWRFRKGEKTREDVAPPMAVTELLTTLRERGVEWEAISEVVHGPTAVPVLSTGGGGAPEMTLDADAWSMLCKIDGERSVAELARDCGYTLFEAGQVLVSLVQSGLVDIEEDVEIGAPPAAAAIVTFDESVEAPVEDDSLYGATSVGSALAAEAADAADLAAGEAAADEAAIAAVAAAVAAIHDGDAVAPDADDSADPVVSADPAASEDPAASADAAVSEDDDFAALARLVSEVAAGVRDDEAVDTSAAAGEPEQSREPAAGSVPLRPDTQAFATSVERVSAALAEALGPAPVVDDPFEVPAEMRVKRTRKKERQTPPPLDPRAARVRAAAAEELAAAHALAQALRAAAAEEPTPDEVARQREAHEAARLEAERLAAEQAAQAAAEAEAARVAAEEAARAEADRLAAEEAARLEAERLAAEAAARVAAEEAARLEAERLAAEEAARVEAERIAAEEAARVAAEEEAARVAAEEAARLEAETARLAAEEAARVEAERIAAEETARLEAEDAAARLEAERFAAEEAARVLAEEEAAREAAERLAAEKSLAEDEAWTEYWSREADRVAAMEAAVAEAERLAAEQARELAEEAAVRAAAEAEARAREEDAAEEASRLLLNKSAASAALAELAQDFDSAPPAEALEDETADEIPDEPVGVPAMVGAPSMEMADTAALLRELSSLGLEDDPAPPPPPRAPARPTQPVTPAKKKRGLFGR
jgi:hypothetical protein